MKTFVLLSALLAAYTLHVKANHLRSSLTLRMSDGSPIAIVMPDRPDAVPGEEARLDNLGEGKHHIKIIRYRQTDFYIWAPQVVFDGMVEIKEGLMLFGVVEPNRGIRIFREVEILVLAEGGAHDGEDAALHAEECPELVAAKM